MFTIQDGRSYFYQWDINRQLIVEDTTITEVHFCNRTNNCSLVVEVKDGLVDVPNILLQEIRPIRVYAYVGDGYTKVEETFEIKPKSKPDVYVYTETDIKSYEAYDERLKALEEGGSLDTEQLEKDIAEIKADYVKSADLDSYVTEEELDSKGYLTEHQSLEGLATEDYVDAAIVTNTEDIAVLKEDVDKLESAVADNDSSIEKIQSDITELKADIPTKVSQLQNDLGYAYEVQIVDFTTADQVTTMINDAIGVIENGSY